MEQFGKVIEVKEHLAKVQFVRHAACKHCGACGMGHSHEEQMMKVDAKNLINAKVGDYVKLEISSRNLLMASFIVYIVPLIFLFLGYFIFSAAAKMTGNMAHADGIGGTAGVILMVASFLIIRWYDRKMTAEERMHLEITGKVDPDDVC